MAQNFEKQLKELRKQFTDAKNEEIRLQTKLEEAKKRRKEAIEKIKAKGYDVKTLPDVIKDKQKELEEAIKEIQSYLPQESSDDDDDWDDEE